MAKISKKTQNERILNCIPSTKTENDFSILVATAAGVSKKAAAIPASKDLRDNTWWAIGNQGSTGSCVGWASADSVLRWHLVKSGLLLKTQKLSVRFQWMASKETDEFNSRATTFIEGAGTSLKGAVEIAKKYGTVLETVLPFGGGLTSLSEQVFYTQAATRRINAYFNLFASGDRLVNLRNWIANNGPVITRLDVDSTWDNVTSNGKLTTYNPIGTRGGHAVSIVGYTPDGFIIRNSWGTTWGDKGFAYASNAYTLAAFTEAYGVTI